MQDSVAQRWMCLSSSGVFSEDEETISPFTWLPKDITVLIVSNLDIVSFSRVLQVKPAMFRVFRCNLYCTLFLVFHFIYIYPYNHLFLDLQVLLGPK